MTINCIIVDDEPLAQDVLETYIEKVSNLNLVARCNNAVEAFEVLHNNQIDLIFLDIQMPQITGLDFLKSIKNPPAVVFTTAYSKYAVEGFELDAVDYLLKPFGFDRFLKAINKVMENQPIEQQSAQTAASTGSPAGDDDYIFVKTDKKIVKINYEEIQYIEGLKDYVMIYTDSGRHIVLMTMKSLEAKLPPSRFKRVHKSYIIGIGKIKSVIGNSIEISDKLIPIGKMYKEDFFKIVDEHNLLR